MATNEELLFEASRRGLLTGERKTNFEEAIRRGIITPPAIPQEELDARQPLEFQESSLAETAGGVVENLGSFASGIVAEPIAGVAGIIQSLNPFADEGAGVRAVKATKELLTTRPKTISGRQQQASVGEALQPVAEVLQKAERALGETTLEVTGSPALAAAAHTLPTAALELLGLKGSKRFTKLSGEPTKRQIKTALVESAPEVKQLKNVARQVYDEIDASGVRVKQTAFDGLIDKIEKVTKRKGLDSRVTQQAAGALEALKKSKGVDQTLTELDTLRNVASNVAKNTDKVEASLGNIMISEIDDFLDNLKPSDTVGGSIKSADTAKKFKAARGLWGRAARAESINDAIEKGSRRAAGAETGIRNELNSIINNKKRAKFFPKAEIAAMERVVKGNFAQNFTRMVGKLGISIDRSPNVFQSIIAGGGLGAVAGGATGALVVPVIGTISKKIAQTLTTKKANFLSNITRAGNDGEKIAKAYLTSVPKAKRNIQDLADLLSDPNVDIGILETIANKTIQDALEIAKGKRQINLAASAAAGATPQAIKEEE